jgi:hypothetical protein
MLICAVVAMQKRRQCPGRHLVVNNGEAAAGLRAIDLPMCSSTDAYRTEANGASDQTTLPPTNVRSDLIE